MALSICSMIITTSLVNGFQKEIRSKVFGFWAHINIVPFSLTKSFEEAGVYKHQEFYNNKSVLPEAAHIQSVAFKGGLLKTRDAFEGIVLKGIDDDFNLDVFSAYLKQGAMLSPDTNERKKQIIISNATAKRLHLNVGDKAIVNFMGSKVRSRAFNVCGIYETGLDEFDRQYALSSITVIQDLNNWGRDTIGGFEVFLKENNLFKSRAKAYFLTLFGGLLSEETAALLRADPLDEIANSIYFRLPNNQLDVQTIKYQNPGIFDWLELQTMNELIILTLMILVAAINMMTALLILILERTNMIGILKALGSTNASIRSMFIYYALAIIGGGLLIGNAVGIGLCVLQQKFGFVKLPQEIYYISQAPIDMSFTWIIALNIFALLVCTVLLLLPSRIIAGISPVKAIRFD